MTKQADLKRRVRDRMAKTGESYAAARASLLATRSTRSTSRAPHPMLDALHVSNGDATDLAGTGFARHILYWRDSLHEGPVPAIDAGELRRIRAEFLVAAGVDDRKEGERMFIERDRTLEGHRDGDYVLWFEADLYDQLQIMQILDRLAGLGVPADRITLICIGEHAGIARFGGLGQLSSAQLRELPASQACVRLTPAALDLATRAWAAFTAPSPADLIELTADRSPELRFLGEAIDRLLREYPSTRDGLSLTQRRVLAALATGAPDAGTAFVHVASRELRPYLGDSWCFDLIDQMARASTPLLTLGSEGPVDRSTTLQLTDAGRKVLAGRSDHIALNGIDRWYGGVHLHGVQAAWRWDDSLETLVPETRRQVAR